jgi:glycosyltransferase involved in cell wall biosynthesis
MPSFLLVLFYILWGVLLLQVFYYLFIFGKFSFGKIAKIERSTYPISVIVCAKNEEENVKKYLPLLANQNYSDFEIVLIDDASSDETLDYFEEFEKQHSNIKLVKVQNNEAFWGNKKFALTLGIKASTNNYLLFTDADCYPTTENWIAEMAGNFSDKKTIVLGYGAYEKKEGFLNKIIRFETLLTAIQYFSWAKSGHPYMGVGRNLAYKKSLFFDANGFIKHMKIRSGDDDLFINEVSTKGNTTIALNPDSFTYSKPKETFSEWYLQKRRHISTAKYYKLFDKLQLSIFYFSQIMFIILSVLLLSVQYQLYTLLALIFTRYFITWLVVGYSASKLKEKDVAYWYPFLEIILIFTQLNLFIRNLFTKPITWK